MGVGRVIRAPNGGYSVPTGVLLQDLPPLHLQRYIHIVTSASLHLQRYTYPVFDVIPHRLGVTA